MNTDKKKDMPAFEELWSGKQIELPEMLEARERRAYRQQDLLDRFHKPILCFTMNIAGPIKNNELIRRCFDLGADDFRQQLTRLKKVCLFQSVLHELTGNEAYFVVDMDPFELKRLTCQLEDQDELGRLYDMDVLYPDTKNGRIRKIDREEIGHSSRTCLICGAPGKDCSSRRLHSVPEIQRKTADILYHSLMEREAGLLAEYAVRALLYEVCTTPKPGLVDRNNNGSHKDMDFYTFLNSSAALWPYFEECAQIGQQTAMEDAPETFRLLRPAGRKAESRMLKATSGVNTHKGAIFSMGIAVAAAGRLSVMSLLEDDSAAQTSGDRISEDCGEMAAEDKLPAKCSAMTVGARILAEVGRMTAGLVQQDLSSVTENNAKTFGEQLYVRYGITGIRGQAEAGLPAVAEYGLPLLEKLLSEGKSKDEAGAAVLMNIIAHTTDTNLIHRSSVERQQKAALEADRLLREVCYTTGAVNSYASDYDIGADNSLLMGRLLQIDQDYIRENLSPGGSADLLAVCWFLYSLEEEAKRRN